LGPRQRAALEHLVDGAQPAALIVRAAGCDHSTLRALEARGLIGLERVEQRRRPGIVGVGASAPRGLELTPEQRTALAAIEARFDSRAHESGLLLHGVTGSGKTEVYLRAVAS